MTLKALRKDHVAAGMCVLLGAGIFALGLSYGFGTLTDMGAGFMPVAIGTLLVVVGLAIGASAGAATFVTARSYGATSAEASAWPRAWICIVGGILAFMVLGEWTGLAPASFVSVFIWALGDRKNTWRSAALLAALLTVFGVVVFYYGLNVQLPLFGWE